MALPVVLGAAALRLLGQQAGKIAAKKGIRAVRNLAKSKNLKVTRNVKDGEIYISPGASEAQKLAGQKVAKTMKNRKTRNLVGATAAGYVAGKYSDRRVQARPTTARQKARRGR